jgi:hypothetical protein
VINALTIISGGQTGVDRAALDFAIHAGIPHDGWCPAGRRAEDGPLEPHYQLRETPSRRYDQRTRWNIRDSEATAIFAGEEPLTGGTRLTADVALREDKPVLVLLRSRHSPAEAARNLQRFLDEHRVARLNIAGPRRSQDPELGQYVWSVLDRWVQEGSGESGTTGTG